jgi:hypothetical protein
MTRLHKFVAVAIAAGMMTGAPCLAPAASAQSVSTASGGSAVPFILWAATGAVIGAVAWPMLVGGAAVTAVPAGIMSIGTFMNTGAAAGAVVGGGGYLMTR